jgi:hypothetical protein
MVFQDVFGDPEHSDNDYGDIEESEVCSSLNSSREFNVIESA